MGGCTSRQSPVAVAPALTNPAPLQSDIERDTNHLAFEYNYINREIKKEKPFILTMDFITRLNSLRDSVTAILQRYAVEEPVLEHYWENYFTNVDVSLRKEIHKRFIDGRVRIMANVIQDPIIMDMILTQKVVGDAESDGSKSAFF